MPSLRPKAKRQQLKAEPEDESPLSSSGVEESDWETPRKKRKVNSARRSIKSEQKSKPVKVETEEDIYALPIGTSDEEGLFSDVELSDGLETPKTRVKAEPEQTLRLEEKLQAIKDEEKDVKLEKGIKVEKDIKFEKGIKSDKDIKVERDIKLEKDIKSPPSSSLKRSSQKMLGSGDIKEEMFDMWSQPNIKKRRSVTFGRRKTLDSSMTESHPPSSAPPPKSSLTSVEPEPESSDDEWKGKLNREFKVPLEFDPDNLPSPSPPREIADSEDETMSPLSSAPSFDSADFPLKEEEISERKFNPADYLCPMCRAPVDPGALLMFRAQPRQRIRDQRKFCESHKLSTAEQDWKNAGYPTIDWDKFDNRIESHFTEIEKLLVPETPSYYRNYLQSMLKDGKARNFVLTLEGDALEVLSCGYYGTRGAEKMLHRLTTRYSRKLRRLATEDHIVKKAGVVGYTQAVLVPELALRLIKEDMGVDDASARKIMRDSIDIGEKMNPAPNDFVPVGENEGSGLFN
ncbi:RTC4 family protein [Aspergillus mulundensis]|uniref:Restriction of telomere capping protein 4 n=1 Tax=Aspergillus mulundensis TaxID=1810919 RepID=A0A3D8T4P3_9EURO|nr:Uncharacterized protein DSM5745_00854 [Aspergillus mulundensis]RDW93532.1 Uncharacterized protein DSM5745_00854 [Aspergillus mulundensis]